MDTRSYPRLAMLGGGREARGCIAAVLDTYRACGLFERWPVARILTQPGGSLGERLRGTFDALPELAPVLVARDRSLVHAHVSARSLWLDAPYLALALAARLPLVLQLHGGGFERLEEPARAVLRLALERAAVVVVPHAALRVWIRGVARRAAVRVIPSPVPVQGAEPCAGRPNLVLWLGRLEESRGIFDLLEALPALRRALPNVRLVCAGEGERGPVLRYAERLGVRDALKITGWVGPSGKRSLLENAAVLAVPTHVAGLPLALLEAMAAGVPVVATPVGGIPETLVDGVSGFLAAPGDSATLSRRLLELLTDRSLAARMAAAARETVRARHAAERVVAELEALYASLGLRPAGAPLADAPRADLREAA